jgi:hypothetical protein
MAIHKGPHNLESFFLTLLSKHSPEQAKNSLDPTTSYSLHTDCKPGGTRWIEVD